MAPAKFTQIKQFICDQIESGQWQQHSKVPSENELAERFNVSRMTARRALQELTEQGLLVRSQGAGTFVATFKSQSSMLEIKNIAVEIEGRGHQHHAILLELSSRELDRELAIQLNLNPGDQVYYSEILHCENDQPLQLEQRYVNANVIPGYNKQNFKKITPHEYLSAQAPLTEATHEIEAILPSQTVADFLQISQQQACLQIKRRTWSNQGVVSFAILTAPGDKYRLGGHLTFQE
ncbi:histidine utilization repressor [Endozoicomonas sp. G2_1]|uniref:histidine utilization repressor n=1 Tax=Endozoicomonas sp. G2_1 TaxID=2821091 RepID=UPI001ADBBCAE|nr:histidine utilization repressor [Endozoicomonas sp. G2_1]MBO9490954.1 histidine utilization repressor [Endozoicomonas sp. G2_1]